MPIGPKSVLPVHVLASVPKHAPDNGGVVIKFWQPNAAREPELARVLIFTVSGRTTTVGTERNEARLNFSLDGTQQSIGVYVYPHSNSNPLLNVDVDVTGKQPIELRIDNGNSPTPQIEVLGKKTVSYGGSLPGAVSGLPGEAVAIDLVELTKSPAASVPTSDFVGTFNVRTKDLKGSVVGFWFDLEPGMDYKALVNQPSPTAGFDHSITIRSWGDRNRIRSGILFDENTGPPVFEVSSTSKIDWHIEGTRTTGTCDPGNLGGVMHIIDTAGARESRESSQVDDSDDNRPQQPRVVEKVSRAVNPWHPLVVCDG